MTTPPMRLAVVLSHPIQYYSPWFRSLARDGRVVLRVFYLWDFGVTEKPDPGFGASIKWDVDLLSGYEHEFVPNTSRKPGTEHFWGLRSPTLTARLAVWKPAAILLFGYAYAAHVGTIRWARRNRVPLVFRGDSHFIGRTQPSGWKTWILRQVYRQFAAVTYVGSANRDYFRTLGVPDSRLFFAPHAVDGTFFDPANLAHRSAAETIRRDLGIAPSTRVVLFAGKLVPAKQPRELLEAFLALDLPGTALVIAGDGSESAALRDRAKASGSGKVFFLPFANQSEMPARYLLADVFALPSRGLYETWGLAVNEAMHMNVPCLVSDRVGCQRDLVIDGGTGWVFPAENHAELRERLRAALTAELAPFKARIAEKISGYTYRETSAGLYAALGFGQ